MSLILLGILNSQVSGAAAGAYDLLETQVLGTSAASVTFTGLGSYTDYKHLQIRAVLNNTQSFNDETDLVIQFNSDTGSNYSRHTLAAEGASVFSLGNASLSNITLFKGVARSNLGVWSGAIIDILDFSNTSKNTTVRGLSGAAHTNPAIALSSGAWYNTNAVTSIYLAPDTQSFRAGSRLSFIRSSIMATPTYDLLDSTTLSSSASSVTFSSIDQSYRDLVLVTDHVSVDAGFAHAYVRINGDSSSEYSVVWMQGNGSTASSSTSLPTYILGVSTTTVRAMQVLQFMDYSATDKHKTILHRSNRPDASTRAQAIRWPSTAAISSLLIYTAGSNYAAGSTFYLYGVAA